VSDSQLGPVSAIFLRSESRGTHWRILLPLFLRLDQPAGQVPILNFPRNRVAQLYPRALGLLIHLHIITCYIYSLYMYNTYIRPLLVQTRTADYALSRVVQFATQF
jgi:hypothetical protein